MLTLIRWLLFPISLAYGLVMELRNLAFRLKVLKSVGFDIPVISVGNLAVGGSGKTPMVKYLLEELSGEYNLAVISRGYGRKTTGYRVVQTDSQEGECGDEPLEIKRAFPNQPVVVCEHRALGIAELLADFPEVNLVLMDDAFQHQYVKPTVSLLMSRYHLPFFSDWVMPTGRLREFAGNYLRADAVIFTNTPHGAVINRPLRKPVFYAHIKNEALVSVRSAAKSNGETILVTAIAQPGEMIAKLGNQLKFNRTFTFPDHHRFTAQELGEIANQFPESEWITTEKDWVKMEPILNGMKLEVQVWVVKLQIELSPDGAFKEWLLDKLKDGQA